MKPRKHAELIKAWADGAEIQYRPVPNHGEWQDEPRHLIWEEFAEYRIKPEPKPDVMKVFRLESHPLLGFRFQEHTEAIRKTEQYIHTVFDGETGELKSAEVLK